MIHLGKMTRQLPVPDRGIAIPCPTTNILAYLIGQNETLSWDLSMPTTAATYNYDGCCCTLSNTTGATTINHYDAGNSSINTGKTPAIYNYNDICDPHQTESRSNDKATYADSKVYYYGYRYYSPDLGKWVSRDPWAESAGDNLYFFIGNDALGNTDFLGFYANQYCCEQAIGSCYKKDPALKKLAQNLRKQSRKHPNKANQRTPCLARMPYCNQCTKPEVIKAGGYFWWEKGTMIVINQRGFRQNVPYEGYVVAVCVQAQASDACEILRHELQHAKDGCDKGFPKSCEEEVCREVMAYYCSGQASLTKKGKVSKLLAALAADSASQRTICVDYTKPEIEKLALSCSVDKKNCHVWPPKPKNKP